jgi:dTDP-4-amino-4,6-dideoxygalactose transaminase
VEPIRFPFLRPILPSPDQWTPYLQPAYAAGRYTNFGPVNELFERRLEKFAGVPDRRAVACASGTAGLAAALMGLGVQGQVAMPSFTFPATLHSVLIAGCRPVLCDVDARTWELSADIVESALARYEIRAVVHVRAFGFCRDLQPIAHVCERAGIPLIVDAAAALGGSISPGVAVGGQGTAEVFSLHATKVVGIGEGGAIFCQPGDAARFTQSLNFGLGASGFSRALNGKLSEFAAAVGLAVLDSAAEAIAARSPVARRYLDFFGAVDGITLPENPGLPTWQCFPVLLPDGAQPAAFLESARRRGLELRRYYRPALHPAPVSEALADRMVCFPIYPAMREQEQAEILEITRAVLKESSPAG